MIKNLTPHAIVIMTPEGVVKKEFPSEGLARATQSITPCGAIDGISVVETKFSTPEGLPEPVPGTYLVVSAITAQAAKAAGRTTADLLLTSRPIRDEKGQIIGCEGFAIFS